uniref:Ankyrin repeat and kinase domain containing 1 n=1 Tax=Oncorhynchus kisutch TaxID=8019 RepID=A0A8C7HUW0_ONCKI
MSDGNLSNFLASFGRGIGKFRIFKKDDCEADWIKVTERSFGQVYRVKLKLWRENCALKKEASKMEKVTFKYIYGVCNDPPAVVMEYMSNGSMDHLLTSHALVWPKKFQTIHEATTGMNFLHSMNPPLLHLNLKASSIRLDDHLHIKISVFYLIKWEVGSKKELIENLMARGNICYIPPDFSVVMWEILTQKNLIKVGNVSSGKRSGVEKIPDDKPHKSEQMITIMQRCWDQDPRERPTSQVTLHLIADLFVDVATGKRHTHLIIPCYTESSINVEIKNTESTINVGITNTESSINNVVRLLLTWLGSADECKELRGRMVFHVASVYGHLTSPSSCSVRELTTTGLPDHRSTPGCRGGPTTGWHYTPLHFAALNGHTGICRLLLGNGAIRDPTVGPHQGSVDLPGKGGWTPLHLTCHHGQENVVSKLLAAKANPNVAEDSGWTALHLECNGGLFPCVLQFITHRANVNAQNNSQATPLHLAAKNGSVLIPKALLLNGAERISKDSTGCTALYLTRKCQKEEVVQLLEDS